MEVIDNIKWGTHLCLFYRTKEDLIDILVPYFRAGLENNESCIWVTSGPLELKDAEEALKKKEKKLNDYIKKGQIEILDFSQWYTKTGKFDADRVFQSWITKEKEALKKGFSGLRVAGDTSWLEKKECSDFAEYEQRVDNGIDKYKIKVVCTYSLDKCEASDIIDVVSNHQAVLIRQEGQWKTIESNRYTKTKEILEKSEKKYTELSENIKELVYKANADTYRVTYVNKAVQNIYGYTRDEWFSDPTLWDRAIHPEDKKIFFSEIDKAKKKGKDIILEHRIIDKNKKIKWLQDRIHWQKNDAGKIETLQGISINITGRKQAEQDIKILSSAIAGAIDAIVITDMCFGNGHMSSETSKS